MNELRGPILVCSVCGRPLETIGRWDHEGRPWAFVKEPVWFSVDRMGRGAFRCIDCAPAGGPPLG